jgi:multicomponent Na+:H+ antiporter subunit D
MTGSALTLVGLALLYRIAGSLDMGAVARAISASPTGPTAVAAGFVLTGLAIKSGLVPSHGWFADTSDAAPAPIAALVCGPLSKTIGVYAIVRVFVNVLPATSLLAGLLTAVGIVSLVGGALAAAGTLNLRRLPAFLSLSDNGLIIVAVGTFIYDHVSNAKLSHGMALVLIGAIFHIFAGGISSVIFHLANGAAEFANGGRSTDASKGAGRSLPTVGLAVAAGALSSAGMPPFAGFWSRLLVISGLFISGHPVIGSIALFTGIPILIAMAKVYIEYFSQTPKASPEKHETLPPSMSIPLLLLSLTVLVVGVVWAFTGVYLFQPGADALSELTSHFGFLQ